MLANSVLPVTPTQGGLLPQVGETAGSASFAPVESVSTISLSRDIPGQRAQPDSAPENSGQANLNPAANSANVSNSDSGSSSGQANNAQPAEQPSPDGAKANNDADDGQRNAAQDDQAKRESDQQKGRQEQQQQQDLDIIRQLSQRDTLVRAHEQAHSSVGGQYAGSAQYSYQRGPDGVSYAVGGEVPIDVSAINGDPRATLEKMQLVQRAALAPADPSSQDRRVAALASQQASQARAEIVLESRVTNSSSPSSDDKKETQAKPELATEAANVRASSAANSNSENFEVFNNRVAKINEILLAISRNDVTNATGQLLDDVV
jgi:hypothetical protein